jgi:hypothetical protein
MSITTVENKFSQDFTNFFVSDFMIDKDDVNTVFDSLTKYSIKNPMIKINVINLEEDKNPRVSSFMIFNKEMLDKIEIDKWEILQKLEVDNCQIVVLNEDKLFDEQLDDWLEKCISMKELYNVSEDGKICITSGFGPGIYRLIGQKSENELVAIKMEFIKETI